jgi:hypothetical protein
MRRADELGVSLAFDIMTRLSTRERTVAPMASSTHYYNG